MLREARFVEELSLMFHWMTCACSLSFAWCCVETRVRCPILVRASNTRQRLDLDSTGKKLLDRAVTLSLFIYAVIQVIGFFPPHFFCIPPPSHCRPLFSKTRIHRHSHLTLSRCSDEVVLIGPRHLSELPLPPPPPPPPAASDDPKIMTMTKN